jgi:hypothetical protein
MAKQVKAASGSKNYKPLFSRENYRWMLIG